jgi:hypothetical protein
MEPEVHQEEREIVQDVYAGYPVVELHAIEQRGPSIHEDDVAQVQIAVASSASEPSASRVTGTTAR